MLGHSFAENLWDGGSQQTDWSGKLAPMYLEWTGWEKELRLLA